MTDTAGRRVPRLRRPALRGAGSPYLPRFFSPRPPGRTPARGQPYGLMPLPGIRTTSREDSTSAREGERCECVVVRRYDGSIGHGGSSAACTQILVLLPSRNQFSPVGNYFTVRPDDIFGRTFLPTLPDSSNSAIMMLDSRSSSMDGSWRLKYFLTAPRSTMPALIISITSA